MPNGRRSVPVRKVIAMTILPRWGVGSVNLHQYDPFPLVYPEDKLIVDERIAPIVGRQFKLHVMTHSNHFSLSARYRSKQKKKIYHFNGVQSNREAIVVQPWNASSRLKTGFCSVYVYWPVFGFNQTRS